MRPVSREEGSSAGEVPLAVAALLGLSERYNVPAVDPDALRLQLADLDVLPIDVARQHGVLPLLLAGDNLFLAMVAPSDKRCIDDVEFVSGRKVVAFVADPERLPGVIERAYAARLAGETTLVGPRAALLSAPAVAPPSSSPSLVPLLSEPPVLVSIPPSAPAPAPPPPPVGALSSGRTLLGTPARPIPVPGRVPPPPGVAVGAGSAKPVTAPSIPPSSTPLSAAPPMPSPRQAPQQGLFAPLRATTAVPLSTEPKTASVVARLPSVAPTGKLVWVVDADGASREALREALSELGHSVLALDGVGALVARRADARKPDMVVLDLNDPTDPDEGFGRSFDQCLQLRELDGWREVPWVMLASRWQGWRAADDLAERLGVLSLLPKPLSLVDTVPQVESLLDGHDPRNPNKPLPTGVEAALQASTEAYQRGDYEGAVSTLDHALAVPSNTDGLPRLRYHLGLLLARRGEVFRAISSLEASITGDESFFPALKNLGVLYERVGFRRKALEAWERAFFVAPDSPTQQQIQDRIVALLKPE